MVIIPKTKIVSRPVYLTICPVRRDVHAFAMLNGIDTKPIFHIPNMQPTNACCISKQQNPQID